MNNFLKNYNEDSNVRYFFEVYVKYLKQLQILLNDLSFLSEKTKIRMPRKKCPGRYSPGGTSFE